MALRKGIIHGSNLWTRLLKKQIKSPPVLYSIHISSYFLPAISKNHKHLLHKPNSLILTPELSTEPAIDRNHCTCNKIWMDPTAERALLLEVPPEFQNGASSCIQNLLSPCTQITGFLVIQQNRFCPVMKSPELLHLLLYSVELNVQPTRQ